MFNFKRFFNVALTATVLTSLAAIAPAQAQDNIVKLATTTSTENSGLLGYLLPTFTKDTGYTVQVIATGTGKALQLGRQGDVDIVMTHAPAAEAKFVAEGYGVEPRNVMENDFVILGPKNDPAHIKGSKNATEAFVKIAKSGVPFISRGDNSGTHMKEMSVWQEASMAPEFTAYASVGQGMGKTLQIANEKQGYTLSDRGTYVAYKNKLDLAVDFDGGKALANPYQVILINAVKYPDLNHLGAETLSDWLVSPKGQHMIDDYKVKGEQLFKATFNK